MHSIGQGHHQQCSCIQIATIPYSEVSANLSDSWVYLYFEHRCISVLADKITQTTAAEDRRTRKELQVSQTSNTKHYVLCHQLLISVIGHVY